MREDMVAHVSNVNSPAAASDDDVEKNRVEQVEHATSHDDKPVVNHRMPAILAELSPEDRAILSLKLRKKIDLRLLPMMLLMYIMNYLDRNNIASAKLAGLESDLHLTGSEFQTSVSILFVGYLLMQVPSNLLLNKFGKPAIYLPACMMIWGTVSTCTAAAQSYGGLLACRFVLGVVEAAYFPGCLFYLSIWYTREELVLRTALLYSGSLMSGAFAGLISAGITENMDGLHGLRAWRWLFIIEGSITIGVAFASFFVMPNFPRTTSWLNEKEKAMAVWRLEEDIGADDWVSSEEQGFLHGAVMAVKDIKSWVLLLTIYGFTSSGTVTTFFPAVVKGLGYNNVDTLLLTAPPYVFGTIIILVNAWHADRTRERYLHVVVGPVIAIAGYIIAVTTTGIGPRYFAMMIMIGSNYSGYVVALGWISNVLPRPPAKRAAALGGINALSNICQIYSSYLYPNSGAPQYVLAMCFNCGTALMSIVGATILRILLTRENKKLEQGAYIGHDGILRMDTRVRDTEDQVLPSQGLGGDFRYLV